MQKKLFLSLAVATSLVANEVENLGDITVVSATKSSQSIKDVTSNVDVITAQELEEKHYTTVAQALNSLAGIDVTSNGGMGKTTSVYVRGFDSKRVLVLIDGVRYNDLTGLSGAPFEHLMVADIKQIEVVKGAQSGIWGADAAAGVINIITKDAKKGLHGSVNGEYGSFNTKRYGAKTSYKTDRYYIKASIQKTFTDGFSAQAENNTNLDRYEDDGYANTTINLKAGYKIDDTNKIDISHTIIDAYNEFDGWNAPNDGLTYSKTKDRFSKINFNHTDSFEKLDIYAKKSTFDRDYPNGWTKEYDGEVYEYGVKSNIPYNENDFILVGIDYKTFEHKNSIDEKYTNKGAFVTNSNRFNCPLGGEMIFTQSLRYDTNSKFDDKTTGKIGLKRVINKDLFLSANYGTAFNTPTLYNLFSNYGNEDLKPENTKSYDISVGYKDFEITYFNSKIKDMIDYSYSTSKYENLAGTTTLKGVEIKYSTELGEDFYITSSYTYLDAKNNDNKNLARRAKSTLKFSVDYYGVENLHVGLNGEYVGTRYDKNDDEGRQTGRHTLMNMVTNYDIDKTHSVYAKMDNIFNKQYQTVDGYATAPRSIYVGFEAKF